MSEPVKRGRGRPRKNKPVVALIENNKDAKVFTSYSELKDFIKESEGWLDTQKTPTNPDCEPATKGYVKCVARTLVSNTANHVYYTTEESEDNIDNNEMLGVLLTTMFMCWAGAWVIIMVTPSINNPIAAWIAGTNAITMFSILAVMLTVGHHTHKIVLKVKEPIKAFQKYTPVCEEKKECE